MPPLEVLPKAKSALKKALELDDSLAEAHAQAALLAFWIEWDWKAAESHFKKVLTLNPGLALCHAHYAWYHLAKERFDEAISEIKKAQELDPLLSVPYAMSIRIHRDAGRLDEAIDQFHKAIELDPNSGLAYFHAGTVYLDQGMIKEAFSSFQKSIELTLYSGWVEASLVTIFVLQGKREKAEQILTEVLERKKKMYVSPLCIAFIYHDLGEIDKSFEFLEKAYEERDTLMPFINVFSEMDRFRPHPRFKAVLKKMGL